ncbi:LOB domain-containing protein 37-like [Abrus precatorius]|uniref:LOB domain-containing protein 37-like n=1 Tax=Abrus precatorius TaxID=3816 RepID=A0A8B8KWN5_ABRPR|nr:LOB domain-containing protein 37-like [Abrus precatorius]
MSCNGCRVLRKGCSESCILRPCLQWMETAEAQGHATVFVAKFFGRAGLMSFISNVPQNQRPALFQSLLFEACGRTVNPVNGAVGLLWTGNWHVCQAAVETVLRGGTLRPIPELMGLEAPASAADEASEAEVACTDTWRIREPNPNPNFRFTSSRSHNKVSSSGKRKRSEELVKLQAGPNLDLRLTPIFLQKVEKRRSGSPSMTSEESVTTTACLESGIGDQWGHGGDRKVLNLFI